jgi:putative Mg2+ transporter-C (MgtC) family protein
VLISTVLFRFSVAFVASFLFGFVRQRMGKPIGFGTFIFLAQGSCALALTAITLQSDNPLPLLSAIVTGIGFLGAGALFRSGERVVGFTSAATIWAFAILGLTLGVGEYLIAGMLYATIWSVVLVDLYMQKRWIGSHQRNNDSLASKSLNQSSSDAEASSKLSESETMREFESGEGERFRNSP